MPQGTASACSHRCMERAAFSLPPSLAEPCAHLHVFNPTDFTETHSSA